MEKLATDIYTFENLRKDGYIYVDKSADEALAQIGISFSSEQRTITDVKIA